MGSNDQNRCYQDDKMPYDAEQNCAMWRYDRTKCLYVTSHFLREALYYLTPVIIFFILPYATNLLDIYVVGESFLGTMMSYGLKGLIPITAFKRKILLEANDFVYHLFKHDEILGDTKFLNKLVWCEEEKQSSDIATSIDQIKEAGDNASNESL